MLLAVCCKIYYLQFIANYGSVLAALALGFLRHNDVCLVASGGFLLAVPCFYFYCVLRWRYCVRVVVVLGYLLLRVSVFVG